MNMVLEKNIPALQQSIRDLDNQCQGALKQSVMDFVQSWGMEELTGQRTMYNINIFCYSHHPRQFHLWFLKQKKKKLNNTRETTTKFFFLTKGKRQKHLSGTIFLTSIPPHRLNLLSSQVIPANYPADVFGKIKESNQSNRDESAFSVRPVPRQGAVYEKDSFFSLSCRNNTKKQSTVMQSNT